MRRVSPYIVGICWSVAIACIGAIGVYRYILPKVIIAWDEAANILWGYKIYESIMRHNMREFLSVSKEQIYYPPLQSWFIGLASTFFGFSVSVIRTYHLVWLLVISPMIFHLGHSLDKNGKGVIVGLGASLLFIISPMTFVFSGIALKEVMGTALTLFSFIAYRRLEERHRVSDAVLAGSSVVLLFYFKYNYALLLCVGYGILTLIRLVSRSYSAYRAYVVFWLLGVAGSLPWVIIQGRDLLTRYVDAQTPQTIGIGTWFQKIAFYPHAVMYEYAPGSAFGVCMLIAFVCCLWWFRNTSVRAMWVVTFSYFLVLGLYSDNLHERYVFPVIPFLYVMTSYAIVRLGMRLARENIPYGNILKWGGYVTVPVLCVWYLVGLPDFAYSLGAHTLRSPIFNQSDYRDTLFDFDRRHWSHKMPTAGSEFPADVVSYVMGVVGPSADIIVKGNVNELSPKFWELSFLLADRNRDTGKSATSETSLVTVKVLPESRFFTRDYLLFNAGSAAEAELIQMDNGYVKVDEKHFTDLGMVVRIFRKSHGNF